MHYFFGLDPDVHSNNTNIKGKKRPKQPKKQQQPTKLKYSSYYGYEFLAVQTFSDLWEMLGVNTRESNNLTDNSSILERCIECTEGRCILHKTQEAPVNGVTPLVNQDNCVKSEMIDGSENNILVISDDDHEDHTDSWNIVCDIKPSFGMASDVYENTNYSVPVMCQGQSEMVHSDSYVCTAV